MKSLYFIIFTSLLFFGCVTDGEFEIQKDFRDDQKYFESYTQNTRKTEVFKNMETKFFIEATYLAPAFRSAFSERLKKLYLQDQPFLDEAGGKAGFFVVINSPDDEDMNLSDNHLWTILLKNNVTSHAPILVKTLGQKKRWEPFFNVNKWSKEYLIIFDTPSITTNSEAKVAKESLNLTFAHSSAKVEFSF